MLPSGILKAEEPKCIWCKESITPIENEKYGFVYVVCFTCMKYKARDAEENLVKSLTPSQKDLFGMYKSLTDNMTSCIILSS